MQPAVAGLETTRSDEFVVGLVVTLLASAGMHVVVARRHASAEERASGSQPEAANGWTSSRR